MKLGVTRIPSFACIAVASVACLLSISAAARADTPVSPAPDEPSPGLVSELLQGIRAQHRIATPRSASQWIRSSIAARSRLRGLPPLAVERYDLRFDPDISGAAFKASIDVDMRNTTVAARGSQTFYLPNFTVTAARLDNQDIPFEVTPLDYGGYQLVQLEVTFPVPIPAGATPTLSIDYEGPIDCSPGSFLGIAPCVLSPTYTVFSGFTFGPYFENDSSYDFTMTWPSNLSATVSANLVGQETVPGGLTKGHWRNDRFGDLLVVGIGDFEVKKETYGALEVGSYTRPQDGPHRAAFHPFIRDIVDFYSSRYHPYEFGKLEYIGVGSDLGFGGMAGSSLLLMADYNFAADPKDHPAYASTFAHEIGHQWFAYMFSPRDPRGPWLSEGQTEYLSSVYEGKKYTEFYGRDLDSIYFRYYNNAYIYAVPPEKDEALTGDFYLDPDMDQDLYVQLAYVKGPLVANVIAQALGGGDAYAGAISAIAEQHLWEHYDTATFQSWLEDASGQDLSSVFDRWVYRAGYPTYQVRVVDSTGPGGGTVRARVTRSEVAPGALQMLFKTATSSVVKTVSFPGDELVTELEATLDQPLTGSRLDPDYQQLRRLVPEPAGDINGNGQVDGDDILYLAWSLGSSFQESQTSSDTHWLVESDVVIDGVVDDTDLATALDRFGVRNQ